MSFFDKLSERIQSALENASSYDPSHFEDPIASQTSWGPAKNGGSNFKTHRMEEVSDTRLKFKASVGMLLFSGVFFAVGIFAMGFGGVFQAFGLADSLDIDWNWALLLFGGVFAAAGAFMYYYATPPIVFDKEANVFWKGRKKTQQEVEGPRVKHLIPLDEIHAIQIIPEYLSGESSYYSYELNLVLKDASRVNVIDHGHLQSVREDANAVARFLNVPLWDAV